MARILRARLATSLQGTYREVQTSSINALQSELGGAESRAETLEGTVSDLNSKIAELMEQLKQRSVEVTEMQASGDPMVFTSPFQNLERFSNLFSSGPSEVQHDALIAMRRRANTRLTVILEAISLAIAFSAECRSKRKQRYDGNTRAMPRNKNIQMLSSKIAVSHCTQHQTKGLTIVHFAFTRSQSCASA